MAAGGAAERCERNHVLISLDTRECVGEDPPNGKPPLVRKKKGLMAQLIVKKVMGQTSRVREENYADSCRRVHMYRKGLKVKHFLK